MLSATTIRRLRGLATRDPDVAALLSAYDDLATTAKVTGVVQTYNGGAQAKAKARSSRAVESFRSAATDIGPITAGCSVFALTRGQWSMIDAVLHVLDCVGPSRISLWTWTVAEYEVQVLQRLQADSRLLGATLVIDGRARDRNESIIAGWQQSFGPESVRYVVNHAKIARIESASGLRVLCRGSANLNFNPRFEQFDLSEGCEAFDLVRQVEDALPVLALDAGREEMRAASRVSEAFDAATLAAFAGVKTWAK